MKILITILSLYLPSLFLPSTIKSVIAKVPLCISASNSDSDKDGLTDHEEKQLCTNPFDTDTDNDGLLDGFEVSPGNTYPALRELNPRHADLIVFVKWRPELLESNVRTWMEKSKNFYNALNVANPDGNRGINLISIYGGALPANVPLTGGALLPTYFPADLKGKAHWFEFFKGGGGQTPGTSVCNSSGGSDANWMALVHEMGHQLGLTHRGPDNIPYKDGEQPLSPIYPSLMNYRYSYGINNSPDQINYSYGIFSGTTLNENDMSEFYANYSLDQFSFLSAPPFSYPLKAGKGGKGTYIDWNRNGIFGESHYRCDINQFGDNRTARYDAGLKNKITVGNVCALNSGSALHVLFCSDNSISETNAQNVTSLKDHPAEVSIWRRGSRHTAILTDKIVRGDISAVRNHSWVYLAVPVTDGTMIFQYAIINIEGMLATDKRIPPTHTVFVPQQAQLKSQIVLVNDAPFLFTWSEKKTGDPNSNKIFYSQYTNDGKLKQQKVLTEISQTDIGLCWDSENKKLCLARTIAGNHPRRIELVRYNLSPSGEEFQSPSFSLVGLPTGPTRTGSKPAVAFLKLNYSMPGRVYVFYRGDGNDNTIYCSREVGDATYKNGWEEIELEGATTFSSLSVTNFERDIVLAFRSAGDNNNIKSRASVIFNGSGIDKNDMHDYNDVEYIRNTGLKKSLQNCK